MTKHSFSLSLEEEDYQALKDLAEREDRHIYEQARHMLRRELEHRQMVEAALRNPQTPGEGDGHVPDTSPDSTLGELERAKESPPANLAKTIPG